MESDSQIHFQTADLNTRLKLVQQPTEREAEPFPVLMTRLNCVDFAVEKYRKTVYSIVLLYNCIMQVLSLCGIQATMCSWLQRSGHGLVII